MDNTRAFPKNTEVDAMLTFVTGGPGLGFSSIGWVPWWGIGRRTRTPYARLRIFERGG